MHRVLLPVWLFLLSSSTWAATPGAVFYQGSLLDNGLPAADGAYTMEFALFDAPTGGAALASSGEVAVQVVAGAFSHDVGALFVDGGADAWLELRITPLAGGVADVLPRTRIVAQPYAVRATFAEHVEWEDVLNAPTPLQGPTGAVGPTGASVTALDDGISPECPFGGVRVFSGSNQLLVCDGATGATGPTGPAGANGVTGPTGAAGANGTNGATGATGATGPAAAGLSGNTGQTLRFNGTDSVVATSNLTNTGQFLGVNQTVPNVDLHIGGATAANKRIQFTHSGTGTTLLDGAMLGISGVPGDAFFLQNEAQHLWFGTSGNERMRIDAQGRVVIGSITPFSFSNFTVSDALGNGVAMYGESNNSGNASIYVNALNATANTGVGFLRSGTLRGYVGFNASNDYFVNVGSTFSNLIYASASTGAVGVGTSSPNASAKLDVNGPVKLGTSGTVLTAVIKNTQSVDLPSVAAGGGVLVQTFTVANATTGSSVQVSPEQALPNGLILAYARVSAANTVEVKFINVSASAVDATAMNWNITVIN